MITEFCQAGKARRVPRGWGRPRWPSVAIATPLLLLWFSTSHARLAVGNGTSFEVRLSLGALRVRWGQVHGFGDKWYYAHGIEVGAEESWKLGFHLRPGIEVVTRPWSLYCECPFWLICLPAVLLTLAIGSRRPLAFPPTACRGCGYDLRGSTGGRCPECGCAT